MVGGVPAREKGVSCLSHLPSLSALGIQHVAVQRIYTVRTVRVVVENWKYVQQSRAPHFLPVGYPTGTLVTPRNPTMLSSIKYLLHPSTPHPIEAQRGIKGICILLLPTTSMFMRVRMCDMYQILYSCRWQLLSEWQYHVGIACGLADFLPL